MKLTKPAGCFLQLVAAALLGAGLYNFSKEPPDALGAVILIVIGGTLLLLGRKTT